MIRKWMVGAMGLASLAVAGMASAAEPATAAQPTLLTAAQMDNTTAGGSFVSINGNNLQIANVVQIAVVVGSYNNVAQAAIPTNFFSR